MKEAFEDKWGPAGPRSSSSLKMKGAPFIFTGPPPTGGCGGANYDTVYVTLKIRPTLSNCTSTNAHDTNTIIKLKAASSYYRIFKTKNNLRNVKFLMQTNMRSLISRKRVFSMMWFGLRRKESDDIGTE